MKEYILLMLLWLGALTSFAQSITLEECYKRAEANYPMIKQYNLVAKTEQYTLSNVSKAYLPQFSANGQATYQSAVTKLPIDFSSLGIPANIKSLSKDQYKATIDVSQIIWDGGNIQAQREITKANTQTDKLQIEVTLYSVREKVNQLYFGLLAIDKQLNLLGLLEENMLVNKKVILSMFENGTATQSDLDQIEVELLNISQNKIEQYSLKSAFLQMLSLYINKNIDANTTLVEPQNVDIEYDNINRPELDYYNSRQLVFDMQQKAVHAKNMPQLGLFVQGGYGRPGLNMLEDKFSFYAIGGVRFSWNFGNLYTRTNEKRLIELNKSNIGIQQETFLFNTRLQLTQQREEILKVKQQLQKDNKIILLRERVKIAAESKYKNGVYQVNDLIRDINAENQARQIKAMREIQYLQSIYNYRFVQGN